MKEWYAIYTRPRAEKKVAGFLVEKGIDTFLPLQMLLRRWSDRKKWVEIPLISGYCFVNIEYKDHLKVLQTDHVLSFVRFSGMPARIPAVQIEFLKRMLKQKEIGFELTQQMPKPGQKVEIIAGPFIGLQAELVKIKGKSRVCIRIEQILNSFLVDIPPTDLMVIP